MILRRFEEALLKHTRKLQNGNKMNSLIKLPKGKGMDAVAFPRIPPEKNVEKYFESKCQNEKIKKYPEWDKAFRTPSMELVKVRREFLMAEHDLKDKRKEMQEKRLNLDEQWEELAQKELDLKKSFISYNKFIKENQEKRERADKRIAEEQLIHEKRDAEIRAIQDKIDKMTLVKTSLERYVSEFKVYEEYLLAVVNNSIDFKNIYDVLNRFDALTAASHDLIDRQKRDLEILERTRLSMVQLTEEKNGTIMGLNNQLAELQSRYEKAKNQALYWETVVNRVKNRATAEVLKIDLVKQSCWDLYVQLCRRKSAPVECAPDDVEHQLLFVKHTIIEFKKILKIAQKRSYREANCSAGTPRSF